MSDDPRFKVGFHRSQVGFKRTKDAQLNKAKGPQHAGRKGPKEGVEKMKQKGGMQVSEEDLASAQVESGLRGLSEQEQQEAMVKDAELWNPDAQDAKARKEEKERSVGAADNEEGEDQKGKEDAKSPLKGGVAAKSQSHLARENLKDGFEAIAGKKEGEEKLTKEQQAQAKKTLNARSIEAMKALGSQTAPRDKGKPADAFQILHAAQDPGVFFKEDGRSGGVAMEGVDPELAEAVREARALLEPVPGIDRIFPGKNDENASIVVVVVKQGFGEAQLKLVPETVRKFETVVAIPYDLLPLKRERSLLASSQP